MRDRYTPDDILLELANRKDDWSELIQKSLVMNPRYKEMMKLTTGSSVNALPKK